MALIAYLSLIDERCAFAVFQFGFAHKQVNRNAAFLVLDNIFSFLAGWRSRVLALPVKCPVIDPVVQVAMVFSFALLIDRNQKHYYVLVSE